MAEQAPEPLEILTDREATRYAREMGKQAQAMLRMGELARYIEAHNRMLNNAENERTRVGEEMSELQAERANLKKIVGDEIAAEREKRTKPLESRVRNLTRDVNNAIAKLSETRQLTDGEATKLRQIQVDIDNMTETRNSARDELQTTTQILRESKAELSNIQERLAIAKEDLRKINHEREQIQKEFNDWNKLVQAVNR